DTAPAHLRPGLWRRGPGAGIRASGGAEGRAGAGLDDLLACIGVGSVREQKRNMRNRASHQAVDVSGPGASLVEAFRAPQLGEANTGFACRVEWRAALECPSCVRNRSGTRKRPGPEWKGRRQWPVRSTR